ncbi:MAG: right-handed parallel beta-helix repeat-containing protein [Thermoguttaceae bacterium]
MSARGLCSKPCRAVLALALALCWAIGLPAGTVSGAVIYVDNMLARNCAGDYSVARRDGSGKDGAAYKTVVEAANAARAGDVVLLRAGVYHASSSVRENDVLWPKNSGTAEKPIVFRAYPGERVVLGQSGPKYPDCDDLPLSINRGVVTLKDVSHVSIEGLQFSRVAGWVFARNCHHVAIRDCVFADALHGAKGTARFLECRQVVIDNCTFRNSSFDAVQMEKCDHSLIENCTFDTAEHSLLALRGSSFNMVRHCRFDNPYFEKGRPNKLVEVYDIKPDRREADDPGHILGAAYDSTKHNLFERNFFGYHPFYPQRAAQPSAVQYSGQEGIIRFNVFCNPPGKRPDAAHPGAAAGGSAIIMRWGGSWDGWNPEKNYWMGEGHEAGFVTGNRVFHNTFYGYDNGCVTIPPDRAVSDLPNPPPVEQKNPARLFHKKFAFADNQFINNIFLPGPYRAHTTWTWQTRIAGKPVAVAAEGLLTAVKFINNDFFAAGPWKDEVIYVHTPKYPPPGSAERMNRTYPGTFAGNLQQDPLLVDPEAGDFRLKEGSPMIGAGALLAAAVGGAENSRRMTVNDVGFFFDGFGIEGQQGDLIRIEGWSRTARVVAVDYDTRTLELDRPLSWHDGQKVSLAYAGKRPDVGACEHGLPEQAVGPRKARPSP